MGLSPARCTLACLLVSTISVVPTPVWGQDADGAGRFELLGERLAGAGVHRLAEGPVGPVPQAGPARGRGALWGGGIGLVAGGLLGALSVSSDESDGDFGGSLVESSATGEAVVLGALVGAGIGAVLGATVFAPSPSAVESNAGLTLSIVPVAAMDRFGTVVRIGW